MELDYLIRLILQFFHDPFNNRALADARSRIKDLEAEIERLTSAQITVQGPETKVDKPEPLRPFRVRLSARDRRAKKEASFNKVYRNVAINEAIVRGEIDVSVSKNREDIFEPGNRSGNGRGVR